MTTTSISNRLPAQSLIEKVMAGISPTRVMPTWARVLGVSPLSDELKPWYLGALGELEVARMLTSLPDAYAVFHSVPIGTGDADVDHIVLGPSGVFTVNTKHHHDKRVRVAGGALSVSGLRTDHIHNATYEADRVTTLLRRHLPELPPAQSVIAVVGARAITSTDAPSSVTVLESRRLRRWIVKQPHLLSREEVALSIDAMDSPLLWRDEPPADAIDLERFDALRRDVRESRRVRMLWALGWIAGCLVAAIAVVPQLPGFLAAFLAP